MASPSIVTLSEANFEQEVVQSDVPVLVDFWAEWCGPCRMLAPAIDDLAEEYKGKVKVAKIDTDNNRNLALKYRISSIPMLMIFKKGQPVYQKAGLQGKPAIKAALDAALAG